MLPSSPSATSAPPRRRVLHFVTGGFSGATQVAVDLCLAQLHSARIEPILVLRRKQRTENATKLARIQALRDQGLPVHVVPGWAHLITVWALRRLCERLRPDVVVAHGFPEHLLGRRAGRLAGVPALVQVEHNSRERYTPCARAQARRLSAVSARLVGVSEGVRRRLVDLGMPEEKTTAIPNGIRLDRFETRKVIFAGEAIQSSSIVAGIRNAVEFELAWLKNKRDYYGTIAAEDEKRITMMETRLATPEPAVYARVA